MPPYSVMLVEDDTNTRNKLAQAITGHRGLSLLAAVDSCHAAREVLARQAPDILVTDLGLPDGEGVEIIEETVRQYPDTEIMVITVFGDERHVLSAIEAGASGYLLKDSSMDAIGASIIELAGGASPMSPSIARHLLRRFQGGQHRGEVGGNADAPHLTERETEVLRYVAKGFSYNEIAGIIDVSGHTVTSHIKNIYKKLSVRSRGEAVFEAMQLGIIRLDE